MTFDEYIEKLFGRSPITSTTKFLMEGAWDMATSQERERCARICDKHATESLSDEEALHYRVAAKDIRKES